MEVSKVKLNKLRTEASNEYLHFLYNNVPHIHKLSSRMFKDYDILPLAIEFYKRKHLGGNVVKIFKLSREFRKHLMEFSPIEPEFVYGRNRIDYLIIDCAYERHCITLDDNGLLEKFNYWKQMYRSKK